MNEIYLENWQIRRPSLDFESRDPLVIALFLAIVERKNCVLKPEYRGDEEHGGVAVMGNVFNFPGDVPDDHQIMVFDITKIEHKRLPESKKIMAPLKIGERFSLNRREKEFATFVTAGGITFMLGYVCQELYSSADGLRWEMMKSTSRYDPPSSRFGEYSYFFDDVNTEYQPFLLGQE